MSQSVKSGENNFKGLWISVQRYINGDDVKLHSNIIDVEKGHEAYLKKHEGKERPKFKFFDYTMNTYLILFTVTTIIPLAIFYFFFNR